jgi:hypothetical protein
VIRGRGAARALAPVLVAVLAAVLAGAGCTGACAATGGRPFTVRKGAALHPGPAPAPVPVALRTLHLADFGESTSQQAAVAEGVARAHARAPFALALFPGDLLYPCGPDPERAGAEACAFSPDGVTVATPPAGPPDPAFARLHEEPLAGLAATPAARVHVALGNHDVATWAGCGASGLDAATAARRKACLAVAHASPLWSMPGRHYVVDEGPARFVVVDSNVIYSDYGGFTLDDEVAFVATAAAGCAERACFLVGHHPPTTAGVHVGDFTPEREARFARLLDAAGPRLRAWLAGHDHDLQHLRTAGGLDVLVSGNGATARPAERFESVSAGGSLLFGSVRWGFGVLTVHGAGWDYQFADEEGTPLYCCAAAGEGRCEPSGCRAP